MRESQPNNWDFPKDVGAIIRDGTLKKTKIGQEFAAKLGSLFASDGGNDAGPLEKMANGLLHCLLKGPESARVAVDVLLHAATNNTSVSKKKPTRCRYENSFDFSPTSAASHSFNTFVSYHSSGTPSKCKKRKAYAHAIQSKDAMLDIDEKYGPKRFRRNAVVFPPTNFLHTLADAAVANRDSARASCKHVSFVTPSSPAPAPSAVTPSVGHKGIQKPSDRADESQSSELSPEMYQEYFVEKHHIDIADGKRINYYRSCRADETLQLCHLFALGLSLLVRGTPLCPCHNEPLLCVVRAPFKCPFNQEETARKRAAAHAQSRQSAKKPVTPRKSKKWEHFVKRSYKIFVCKRSSPPAQFSNLRCVDATGSHGHLKNLAPVGGLGRWDNEVLKCRSKLFTRCKGCLGLFCKDTDRRLVAKQRDCRNSACPQLPEAVLSQRMAPISRACAEAGKSTHARALKLQQQSATDSLYETLQDQELDADAVLRVLVSKTGLTGYVEVSLRDIRVEGVPSPRPVHELDPIVARVVLIRDAEGVLGLLPPEGKCLPLLDH